MSDQYYDEYERDEDLLEARRLRRLELKRKRKIRQRIILAVLAVVLILVIVLIFKSCSNDDVPEDNQEDQISNEENNVPVEPEEPEHDPDTIATLAAVGDIMVYEEQISDAANGDDTYDFSSSFSAISAYTLSADLTVGNLELNFLGTAPYSGRANAATFFNAPEVLATNLKDIGFDILQTANTYSITNGMNGLESTIEHLNNAGIDHVGTYITDPAESSDGGVLIREVEGIRIAFLGFTKGLNGFSLPTNRKYSVDLLYTDYTENFSSVNSTHILDRIDAAKALEPDVIVAMVHWGSEFDLEISETQNDITNLMLKNGVDVILGSHSHIVGPMEMKTVETVDGETKDCFVAYSLGNFISSMTQEYANESVILNLEFTKSGETGETTISDVSYTPLFIADHGVEADKRYEVLPIRSAIKAELFGDLVPEMEAAIENLKTHTNSLYDSGK